MRTSDARYLTIRPFPEALVQLINSAQISEQQRSALQFQYLSQLILQKSAQYGVVDKRVFAEAVSQAVADGVLSSSQFGK